MNQEEKAFIIRAYDKAELAEFVVARFVQFFL